MTKEKEKEKEWGMAFLEAMGLCEDMSDEEFEQQVKKMKEKMDNPKEIKKIHDEIEKITDLKNYKN